LRHKGESGQLADAWNRHQPAASCRGPCHASDDDAAACDTARLILPNARRWIRTLNRHCLPCPAFAFIKFSDASRANMVSALDLNLIKSGMGLPRSATLSCVNFQPSASSSLASVTVIDFFPVFIVLTFFLA
jgi:hypothetical protein